jgi:hypothetical protein
MVPRLITHILPIIRNVGINHTDLPYVTYPVTWEIALEVKAKNYITDSTKHIHFIPEKIK